MPESASVMVSGSPKGRNDFGQCGTALGNKRNGLRRQGCWSTGRRFDLTGSAQVWLGPAASGRTEWWIVSVNLRGQKRNSRLSVRFDAMTSSTMPSRLMMTKRSSLFTETREKLATIREQATADFGRTGSIETRSRPFNWRGGGRERRAAPGFRSGRDSLLIALMVSV